VFAQSCPGDKVLCAGRTLEGTVSRVQTPVKLVACLVRKRLVADVTDEALRRQVDCVDVIFQVRCRQIRLTASRAQVWSAAGVLQRVEFHTVHVVERCTALRALVRFTGAMDRPLVVIERTSRCKRLVALIAGHS